MKILKNACFLIFLFVLFPGISTAKVYIDIDSPMFNKFPIAITDFQNLGPSSDKENLSKWFSDQLSRNLNLTNYFTLIDKKAFLEQPGKGGLSANSIIFSDWISIGAESLVKGSFSYNGKDLTSNFMLFDVVLGKLVIGKQYVGKYQDRNDMVLKFSNEILLTLTGGKGVFDTKIAFVGKTGKKSYLSDIYSINFDSSNLTRLTSLQTLNLLPQWSPDGKQIAFTSYWNGNPDLYLIDAKGGRSKRITAFKGMVLAGAWYPDGKSLLITSSKEGKQEIFKFDLNENRLKRLTNDAAISVSPSPSPNGKRIAFASDRSGSPQIYTMNPDGSNVMRLTYEGNYNTSPRWSPKGDRIAFESLRNGTFQIMTIDVNGNNPVQLTSEGRNESPSWSPDGRYIVFTSNKKGKAKLCIINANGSNLRILHEGMVQYLNPCWSPHLNF
jgi:TolB protein